MVAHLTGIVKDSHCIAALAPDGQKVYAPGMAERLIHDTAYAIASALTEKMDYKLRPAEQQVFHRLVYEACKAALRQHDVARDREAKRVGKHASPTSRRVAKRDQAVLGPHFNRREIDGR